MAEFWERDCVPTRVAIEIDRDPGEVLRSLGADRLPFALVGSWAGGGAIVGAEPLALVTGPDALDLPQPDCGGTEPGFVGGGWVGYYGYGLGSVIEQLPPPPPRPYPLESAQMGFYDHVLRLDADGRWWFESLWPDATERRLEVLLRRLQAPAPRRPWSLSALSPAGAGGAGHRAAVAECVQRIAEGELFQANVCLRLDGRFEGSEVDAFADAAAELRPAHGAFIGTPDGALLSFSPELFLRRQGLHVETAPIKGTLPRSDDPQQADATRTLLLNSAKDASEHVMIVDLMRNDLGRVARYGSVRADPTPRVEPHPGLWHLVSTISAELRPDVSDGDLLRATFPPGSVTGAPKVQSMKVISELEGTGREAYTGAIGIIGPACGLELNVAIRTLELRAGSAWIGCGGGIVADSDPDRELHEALDKARPIATALAAEITVKEVPTPPAAGMKQMARLTRLSPRPDPARGLYETLLVRSGQVADLDVHLRRLADALRSGFGVELPAGLRGQLIETAVASRHDRARLRVVVPPAGDVEIELLPAAAIASPVQLQPVLLTGGIGSRKLADRSPLVEFERHGLVALICDIDGTVLEASSANVWATVGTQLLTPPVDGRILPGVVRTRLLELGAVGDYATAEGVLSREALRAADAIVVTSSIRVAAAAALAPAAASRESERVAALIRAALDVPAPDYRAGPPGYGPKPPEADWRRPCQTALAPRSPTLKTM